MALLLRHEQGNLSTRERKVRGSDETRVMYPWELAVHDYSLPGEPGYGCLRWRLPATGEIDTDELESLSDFVEALGAAYDELLRLRDRAEEAEREVG